MRHILGQIYYSQETTAIIFPNSSLEYFSISDFPPTKVSFPEQKFIDHLLVVWVSRVQFRE